MKEKELLEYKLMNIKNKSINIVNNSQKLKEQKLKIIKKGNKTNKNSNVQKKEIIEKKESQNLMITHENISIQTFNNDETNSNERNIKKKEKEKEKEKEKYYNSFEFVSLSENKIKENLFDEDEISDNNELFANENFDDINTIIRKIDFYSVSLRNNPNDIFNTNDNNELYMKYEKKFNKKFDKFIK